MNRTDRFSRLLRLRTHFRRQEELQLAGAMRSRMAAEQETRLREEDVLRAESRITLSGSLPSGEWIALRALVADELERLRLAGIRERRLRRMEGIRVQEVRKALVKERQMEELLRLSALDDGRERLRREQSELDDLRRREEVSLW